MVARTHGHTARPRGLNFRSPTYNTWMCMRRRCYYQKDPAYHRYGAIGVTVCDQWKNSFETFLEDMGERPEGHVLSRHEDKGNYEPGNVVWKLKENNASETSLGSKNTFAKLNEEKVIKIRELYKKGVTYKELGIIFGVHPKTISNIVLRKNWTHI